MNISQLNRLFVKKRRLCWLKENASESSEWPLPMRDAREALLEAVDSEEGQPKPLDLPEEGASMTVEEIYGRPDGHMTRDLALASWAKPESEAAIYVEKAVESINRWGTIQIVVQENSISSQGMKLARFVTLIAYAYDLIRCRCDFDSRFNTHGLESINEFFGRSIVAILAAAESWKDCEYYNQQHYQNHVAAHTMGLIALAVVTDDRSLYDDALCNHQAGSRYDESVTLTKLLSKSILYDDSDTCPRDCFGGPPVVHGEVYDRYRHYTARRDKSPYVGEGKGLQYCHLTLSMLALAAEIAANNNDPSYFLKKNKGGRKALMQAFEYYASAYLDHRAFFEGKGRYYGGETHFIHNKDSLTATLYSPGLFEIGHKRYPRRPILNDLMSANWATTPRGKWNTEILGYAALTHAGVGER